MHAREEAARKATGLRSRPLLHIGASARVAERFSRRLLSRAHAGQGPHSRNPARDEATVAAYSQTERYGLGLARFPSGCGSLWGNGGDIVGYNSSAYADETGERQYVLLVNLDEMSFTPSISRALGKMAGTAFCR